MSNYESGFRGAAFHRGDGWAYDANQGGWAPPTEQEWTRDELDTALSDRRGVLRNWAEDFDVAAYLSDAGVSEENLLRLEQLLTNGMVGRPALTEA